MNTEQTGSKARPVKKILWAVDSFEESDQLTSTVTELVGMLGKKTAAAIEPVYVLSPDQINLPLEMGAAWAELYRPIAAKWLGQKLKDCSIHGLKKPFILTQPKPSLKASVKALIGHAKVSDSDLIVLGSHGRKGLPRFFLGSFAETLLLKSDLPVLIAGPASKGIKAIEHILFPSDFDEKALPVFLQAVGFAKQVGARITLLHALPNPIEPIVQSGTYLLGGGWVTVPAFIENEERRVRKTAQSWIAQANELEVKVELRMERPSHGVLDSILSAARDQKADLIAMAAQSGPIESSLIGSIARQVIRTAESPVWLLRKSESR